MPISDSELEKLVHKQLTVFYSSRLKRLENMRLLQVIGKKNPYMFRAIGNQDAHDIVEPLLLARLSSSDETIFGNIFFEPLAKEIVKKTKRGDVSASQGVDIAIQTKKKYSAYSVKSGPAWGNSSAHSQLTRDFAALQKRLYKIHKQFDPVVGHGYGRLNKGFNPKEGWRDVSGQAFWTEISGDPDMYLKIIRSMKDVPLVHKAEFVDKWAAVVNKFTKQFLDDFCTPDGFIIWEKLTQFVCEESGQVKKQIQAERRKRKKDGVTAPG